LTYLNSAGVQFLPTSSGEKAAKSPPIFFVFSQDHINSGKWNLLPGGKLNITLFEANFILRLEGQWGHPWMDMGFLPPG